MTKLFITIQIASWLVVASICSQTIHKNELDYFIGQLRINNTDSGRFIDCCEFTDWFVERPDPHSLGAESRPRLYSIPLSLTHHLLFDWKPITRQRGEFRWSGLGADESVEMEEYWGYRWYIFIDFFGHELQRNVLTVWKLSGSGKKGYFDSLTFVCGQVGSFNSGIGRADVKRVTAFPDGSFLLIVRNHGEGYARYDFFRGNSPCNFEKFYSKSFNPMPGDDFPQGKSVDVFYNLEKVVHPSLRLNEIIEYGYYYQNKYFIDSTTFKILDLWEMAIEHFEIDTTSSN